MTPNLNVSNGNKNDTNETQRIENDVDMTKEQVISPKDKKDNLEPQINLKVKANMTYAQAVMKQTLRCQETMSQDDKD